MNDDRPPVLVPATPEYALEVIRRDDRWLDQLGLLKNPGRTLSFDTTISAWQPALRGPYDWMGIADYLEETYELRRPDKLWRAILLPAGERTLRDVCEFIAAGTMMPAVSPLPILGRTCLVAGAFLAIRSVLREAGADVEDLSPSTPLEAYMLRHHRVFYDRILRLAPSTLPFPVVHSTRSWHDVAIVGRRLGQLTALLGKFLSPVVLMAGLFLVLVSHIGAWVTVPPVRRKWVEFGDLKTFRDLSYAVADGAWLLED